MKLVHPDMQMQIELKDGTVSELVIENPDIFGSRLSELYTQIDGGEGRFVLSEDAKIMKISTAVECIINPYTLDFNAKKILTKVYAAIKSEIHDTDMYLEYEELLATIHRFASNIVERMDTPLEYDAVSDVGVLLKLLNVKIAVDDTFKISGRLIDYFKILTEYTETRLIILVNAKSYILAENMRHIVEACAYLNMSVLLMENGEGYGVVGSKKYVIDMDGCEIYN